MASLLLHHYWKTLLKKGFPDLSQNFYVFLLRVDNICFSSKRTHNQKVFAKLFSKSGL